VATAAKARTGERERNPEYGDGQMTFEREAMVPALHAA
jgi:hypothetical protein